MIPKIAHMIWIGGKIPKFQRKIIKKNTNILEGQGFTVKLWNNTEISTEFKTMPVWVTHAILEGKYALATDFFRALIVYKYGGIYIDCDHELVKEIPDFVLDNLFFTGRLSSGYINNSIFGAKKHNIILGKIIKEVRNVVTLDNYLVTPRVESLFIFGDIVESSLKDNSKLKVYSSEYFYPSFPGEETVGVTENTIAVSWRTFTWSDKWYIKFCNHFGLIKLSLFLRKFTKAHEHF